MLKSCTLRNGPARHATGTVFGGGSAGTSAGARLGARSEPPHHHTPGGRHDRSEHARTERPEPEREPGQPNPNGQNPNGQYPVGQPTPNGQTPNGATPDAQYPNAQYPNAQYPAGQGQPVDPNQPAAPAGTPYASYDTAATAPKPTGSKRTRVISAVVGIVVFLVAGFLVRSALNGIFGDSKEESIAKTVEQLKEENPLPARIDEVTTLDDVTAEPKAVHYHYTVEGADPSALSEKAISDTVLPSLCAQDETRKILDDDIDMKYTYDIVETGDTYDLTFSKGDC